MRASDLFRLAVSNLKRRRTRTLLTVLGVVIGTASIVTMISLGLGIREGLMRSYQESGSLTMITVYNYNYGSSGAQQYMTDEVVDSFGKIPHVLGTSPALSVYVHARSGAYQADYSILGVSQYYLQQLELAEGSIPKANQQTLSLLYGNMIKRWSFYKGNDYSNYGVVDPLKDTIFYTFPAADNGKENSSDSGAQTNSKKYILKTAGVLAGDEEVSEGENAYRCLADIDTLKTFLRRIYKKQLVPYPQTGKNGKPIRFYAYDTAYVFVDDMNHVEEVQKEISGMGYECYSNMQWLQQSQDSIALVQLVLGGIGAVSLLVAAIGIMNTMMMSIYERTREIGVMKVLGCDMGDIRNMFLVESALIGFFGGIIGVVLSIAISGIINFMSRNGSPIISQMIGANITGNISSTPPWLMAFAVLFAFLVGSISGYIPSVRAMKLSPLAAIRNEA